MFKEHLHNLSEQNTELDKHFWHTHLLNTGQIMLCAIKYG